MPRLSLPGSSLVPTIPGRSLVPTKLTSLQKKMVATNRKITSADDWYALGQEYFKKKHHSKERLCYTQVLLIKPNHIEANYYLGELYRLGLGRLTNNLEKARVRFEVAHKNGCEQALLRLLDIDLF